MWSHWNGLEPVLIELIHERECLWKPDDPGYYNRSLKEKNMIEIAEILQLPPSEIKKKWHSMRVYFVKEWKKVEESRRTAASLDELYKPKFKWFSNMMFIKDIKTSLFRDEGTYSGEDEYLKLSSSSSSSGQTALGESRMNYIEVKEEENDYHQIDHHLDSRLPTLDRLPALEPDQQPFSLSEQQQHNTTSSAGDLNYPQLPQDLRARKRRRTAEQKSSDSENTPNDFPPLIPPPLPRPMLEGGGRPQQQQETCHYGGSSSPSMSTIFYLQKHDTFGLSIAEQLREMTPAQVSVAKLRLQQVIFEVATFREPPPSTGADAD